MNSADSAVPMRMTGAPEALTESLNCRCTESFDVESASARSLIQT
jgi:hypothetical protein